MGSKFCFEILSQVNNSALTVALFSSSIFPSKKLRSGVFEVLNSAMLPQINNSALNMALFSYRVFPSKKLRNGVFEVLNFT